MKNIRVLYTEDTHPCYEKSIPFMQRALGVDVVHTPNNAEAERWIFEEGQRFDVYIFDDSAMSGGGHGITLTMKIAQMLAQEGRGGIVISACSSNAEIINSRTNGISLQDLQDNDVEFFYKHTELFTMFAWLATCLREGKQISRKDWLESVGLGTEYVTGGTGNRFEQQLNFLTTGLEYCPQKAFMHIDMPKFINRVMGGESVLDVLPDMAAVSEKKEMK